MTNLDSIFKSRDITLPTKVHLIKAIGFPAVMYECESWTIKKAECWRIDVFELWCWRRLLWVAFDCKEIQPVHLKGDQPWVFIGRTDVEAETPILWTPDASWLIWKDLDAGKDWRQEEKAMTEVEMVECHHRLNGHDFGWTPGVGDGQGGLFFCSPWVRKESDTSEWLNWTACNIGYPSSKPRSGRIPSERKGYPLQYSGLENSMDCTVHRVAKSWTLLNDIDLWGQVKINKWVMLQYMGKYTIIYFKWSLNFEIFRILFWDL